MASEVNVPALVASAQETIDQWERGELPSPRRAVVHAHAVHALATEVLAARALMLALIRAESADRAVAALAIGHIPADCEWMQKYRALRNWTAKAPSGEETR